MNEIKTLTAHYIDGAFVESHGREVLDIVRPTDAQVIGHVTLGDQEDTRLAIRAAKRAFATYGRSTKEARTAILRRLHKAASARAADLTAVVVEEYGGVVGFSELLVQGEINALAAAEKAPWGGFKYSGVGREYGQYGIEAFVETRAILEP